MLNLSIVGLNFYIFLSIYLSKYLSNSYLSSAAGHSAHPWDWKCTWSPGEKEPTRSEFCLEINCFPNKSLALATSWNKKHASSHNTLGFQTPNVRRYDWTPKTYRSNTVHLRRYDWKTRDMWLSCLMYISSTLSFISPDWFCMVSSKPTVSVSPSPSETNHPRCVRW